MAEEAVLHLFNSDTENEDFSGLCEQNSDDTE